MRRLIGFLLVLVGLLFCLVPLASMEYERTRANTRLVDYVATTAREQPSEVAERLAAAEKFNSSLDQTGRDVLDPFASTIDVTDSAFAGVGQAFAHIIIPKVDVSEPIYLGASNEHLNLGAAQVDGTSLPVGGDGTRSVIAGHRGGRTSYHFLFIDQLAEGDRVYVVVAGEILIYEVYGTEVIRPTDWQKLAAVPGQDTLTLLTCTPPPINNNRLLVNARRVVVPVGAEASPPPPVRTVDQIQAIVAADGSHSAANTVVLWHWGIRIAILALAAALVVTLIKLVRAALSVRSSASQRDASLLTS